MPTNKFDPGFVFKYGSREGLDNLEYEGGAIIFCSNGEHFVDILGTRHRISDIVVKYTQKQLESVGKTPSQIDDSSDDDSTDDSGSDDDKDEDSIISPSTIFYGPPIVYVARDTKHIYLYNTRTKVMDRLTVILAEAATNDQDGNNIVNTYSTKVEANNNFIETSQRLDELQASVAAVPTFIVRVLETGDLPDPGEVGVIYFLPIRGTDKDTVYDTYIWNSDHDGYYLKVGTSSVDLEAYTTLTKLSESLAELKTQLETEITKLKTDTEKTDNGLDTRLTTAESDIDQLQKDVKANQTHTEAAIKNIDFNNYKVAGTYHVSDNTASSNNPTADPGILYVAAADSNAVQLYFTKTEVYKRYYDGSTWNEWYLFKTYSTAGVNADDYGFEG